jgi:hypothetical protein
MAKSHETLDSGWFFHRKLTARNGKSTQPESYLISIPGTSRPEVIVCQQHETRVCGIQWIDLLGIIGISGIYHIQEYIPMIYNKKLQERLCV